MKFSIITPSLNQGQYIRETIESVLSQPGNFSIEYIVIDGDSTDDTKAILKEYEERIMSGSYPFQCTAISFSWWTQGGKGQSQAINEGFAKAAGDMLAWINSDDFYEPGAFAAVQDGYAKDSAASLFCGDVYFKNELTNTTDRRRPEDLSFEGITTRGHRIYQPGAFFPRRVLQEVGRLDESLHYVMDYDLWVRLLSKGTAYRIEEPLATFRIWQNSKTSLSKKKFEEEWRLVHKTYGLPLINPKTVSRLTKSFPFEKARNMAPGSYEKIKRLFYRISRSIHY
ncbi:MAG: glycosyltransferase family 2 protein [Minisyncoccia bacterium]